MSVNPTQPIDLFNCFLKNTNPMVFNKVFLKNKFNRCFGIILNIFTDSWWDLTILYKFSTFRQELYKFIS